MKKKAILFDRDGTLIIDKVYLNDPDKIEYLPNVIEALKKLRDAGYVFAILTNQSGMAKGIVSIENLDEIHRRMRAYFASNGIDILGFYYAPYNTGTNHWIRKPNPGMLERAALDFNLDLSRSWMVGDRMTDVEAGTRATCRTILLSGEETPEEFPQYSTPTHIANGLLDMANKILNS